MNVRSAVMRATGFLEPQAEGGPGGAGSPARPKALSALTLGEQRQQ